MSPPRTGYTFRAFFLGSVFAAALSAGAPYGNMVLRGSYLSQDFSTPGALFLFFVLAGVLNVLYKCLVPKGGLARAELLLIYCMMLIASAITTCGLSEYLLPIMGSWLYFATPENKWDDLFHPYIRDFLVPTDPLAIKHYPALGKATISGLMVEADDETGLAKKVEPIIVGGVLESRI